MMFAGVRESPQTRVWVRGTFGFRFRALTGPTGSV